MSSLTFKALIDGVHFDPKKGAVKIQLIATSHVSMDGLTSLGPADESVRITLESAQTKIEVFPLVPEAEGDKIELNQKVTLGGGKSEEWLKEAAEKIAEREKAEGESIAEFPLSEAKGDIEDDFPKKEEEID